MVTITHALAAIAALGLAISPAMAATRSANSLPKSYSIEASTGQCVEIKRDPRSSLPTSVPVDQAFCKAADAAGSDAAGSNGLVGATSTVAGTGLGFSPALLLGLLAAIGAAVAAASGGKNSSPG